LRIPRSPTGKTSGRRSAKIRSISAVHRPTPRKSRETLDECVILQLCRLVEVELSRVNRAGDTLEVSNLGAREPRGAELLVGQGQECRRVGMIRWEERDHPPHDRRRRVDRELLGCDRIHQVVEEAPPDAVGPGRLDLLDEPRHHRIAPQHPESFVQFRRILLVPVSHVSESRTTGGCIDTPRHLL
jgi:hypothetical protein